MKPRLVIALVAALLLVGVYWGLRPAPPKEPSLRAEPASSAVSSAAQPRPAPVAWTTVKDELAGLSPEAASRRIRQLLDSGVDQPTGLGFRLEADGSLAESPSLRVYLLDQLAKVDRAAAGLYAKTILSTLGSSDEWAVSLRNYARAFPGADAAAFLTDKMRQLLNHAPWQADPSAGYLEAFDVAVYVGGTALLNDLGSLVRRQDNPALAHAAYLSLDRLTLQDSAAVLDRLQNDSSILSGREQTRANYFARASMLDPRQREIVERYLLDPARQRAEIHTFAGLFPNANYMISHNLLTQNASPSRDQLLERDRAALRAVENWLADERFQSSKPELERIQRRLQGFLQSSQR